MNKRPYFEPMTTSTIETMNSLGEDLAKFRINNSKINNFVAMIQGAPVSPVALEVLADQNAHEVVRVRAFARVTTDLRKSI
jgi:hypothetical protein